MGKHTAGRLSASCYIYNLANKDDILTKLLWACNFRTCNAMGLPMKIRASSTFEYVMQQNFSGSQVPGRAISQVMNFGNMKRNRDFFR